MNSYDILRDWIIYDLTLGHFSKQLTRDVIENIMQIWSIMSEPECMGGTGSMHKLLANKLIKKIHIMLRKFENTSSIEEMSQGIDIQYNCNLLCGLSVIELFNFVVS